MSKIYSTIKNISDKIITTNINSHTNKYILYPDNTAKRQIEGGLRLKNKYKHSIKDKPLVTVITVVYNNEKTLERTILSVLNQTYDNIEYIIIDGGSTDNTLNIIKKYDEYIDYYISEVDDGLYFAMNKGLEISSGDYIAILNSDDWYYENGLYNIFNNKKDKTDIVLAATKLVDEKRNQILTTIFPKIDDSVYLDIPPASHPSTLIPRYIYDEMGLFDTKYIITADWDFILKVYEKYNKNIFSISFTLMAYFSQGGISSQTEKGWNESHTKERMLVIAKYFTDLKEKDLTIIPTLTTKKYNEIIDFVKTRDAKTYSDKFISSLKELLIKRSDNPIINKENFIIPFKDITSKTTMIERLKLIKPLDTPYEEDEKYAVITFAVDRNFEPHLWVTISSMIDSSCSNTNYYIYILDGGIIGKNNFYDLISIHKNIKIHFIDMKEQFLAASETRHVSRAGYYRLAIFNLFINFKRVVYIDADSYLLDDIYNLYSLDIGNNLIGVSKDAILWQNSCANHKVNFNNFSGTYKEYQLNYLKHTKEKFKKHFSSAILIFNLENTDINEKQKKLYALLVSDYYSHDQDILNLMYNEDEIYILDRAHNYSNFTTFLEKTDYTIEEEKENYYNMNINPKIVSYISKPWDYKFKNADYADLYWRKISNSVYARELSLILEVSKLKQYKLTFLEKVFSVRKKPRFIEMYLFGIKISIRRKDVGKI